MAQLMGPWRPPSTTHRAARLIGRRDSQQHVLPSRHRYSTTLTGSAKASASVGSWWPNTLCRVAALVGHSGMKCFWFSGTPSLHAVHSGRVSKPILKRLVRAGVSWSVRRRAIATSSFIVMPIIPVRAQGYSAKSGHVIVMFVLVVYQLAGFALLEAGFWRRR